MPAPQPSQGPPEERFIVTGALGCIGAWTVRTLVREGVPVVAFDRDADPRRLRLILEPDELAAVTFVTGDITDLGSIEHALDAHAISHVAHLAALQVPFCRADPPLGALVNVVGTVNVLQAASRRRERIRGLVYTSSIGMFDAADADPTSHRLAEDATAHPTTHYGVYKQANEGNARVYWLDGELASVGLRPMTVYGPGRDQGLTSTPTTAILAAILGRPYEISFGGRVLFQYAADVAAAVVAAARAGLAGANVFNLGGRVASIEAFVTAVEAAVPGAAGSITIADRRLPFPEEIDHAGLAALGEVPDTAIEDGVRATADLFRRGLADGTLRPEHHGLEP